MTNTSRLSLFLLWLGTAALVLFPSHQEQTGTIIPRVHALASSARPSQRNKIPAAAAGRSGGFAAGGKKAGVPTLVDDATTDEIAKRTVRNLFSVCSHIQNPELYQPAWADACQYQTSDDRTSKAVVASKNVPKGGVLTLFPIHALGLRSLRKNADAKKKKRNRREDTEFVAYDADRDGKYFGEGDEQQAGLRMKLNIPLDEGQPASILTKGNKKSKVLFSMLFRDEVLPGWMGGRVRSSAKGGGANCVTIPLPGAAPLCAVVATRDVAKGEELVQGMNPDAILLDECKGILSEEYGPELSELRSYIEMACKTPSSDTNDAVEAKGTGTDDEQLLGPFHRLNEQYPGLKRLHENP